MNIEPHDPRTWPLGDRLARRWQSLWLTGDPTALTPPLVALVGTREPDPTARALATRLATDLSRAGVHVVSGGALGIDAAAHEGALVADARTVVVLPSGLEHWYPRRHAGLYRRVIDRGGALVSQFPPETPPTSWTFPRRNELLAMLADVLVVVQAPSGSGALIAAELAIKWGRRVMAVPASPNDRRSRGGVQLLRSGARACVDAADILRLLDEAQGELFAPRAGGGTRTRARPENTPGDEAATPREDRAKPAVERPSRTRAHAPEVPLDDRESVVYHSLAATARHIDEIVQDTGMTLSELQRALLTLVLGGVIEDRGGGMFARVRV